MSDIAGAIRKVTLDGVTYRVFGDANIKEVGSGWENSSVVTSGGTMRKMVKRVEERESVVLVANGQERETLRDLADGLSDFPMSYETASGDVYRAIGFIEFESRETEENRATVKLIPRDKWEFFAG